MAIRRRTAQNHWDRADSCCNTCLHCGNAVKSRVIGLKIKSPPPTSNPCSTGEYHPSTVCPAGHNSPHSPVIAATLCKGFKPKRIPVLALCHQEAEDSAVQAQDDSTLTGCSAGPQLPHSPCAACPALIDTQSITQHRWIPVALISCWKPLQSFKRPLILLAHRIKHYDLGAPPHRGHWFMWEWLTPALSISHFHLPATDRAIQRHSAFREC